MGWAGRDLEFGCQRQHGVLGRAHKSAAHVGGQAGDAAGERAPANAVAALEDQHVMALPCQFACRGQSGKASADHNNVDHPRGGCHAL